MLGVARSVQVLGPLAVGEPGQLLAANRAERQAVASAEPLQRINVLIGGDRALGKGNTAPHQQIARVVAWRAVSARVKRDRETRGDLLQLIGQGRTGGTRARRGALSRLGGGVWCPVGEGYFSIGADNPVHGLGMGADTRQGQQQRGQQRGTQWLAHGSISW